MNAPAPKANVKDGIRHDFLKAGNMFRFIEPRVELRPYVRQIWVFESPTGLLSSDMSIAAPNGCPKLIILYENSITSVVEQRIQKSQERSLYFLGVRDKPALLRTSRRKTGFIGIEFYPHGAYPIFRMPMIETAHRLWGIDVLFPTWGREVTEILPTLNTVEQKISFIQGRLVELVRKNQVENRIVKHCVDSLKSSDGLMTISDLEQKSNYTRRYLEILFRNHVGLSPKGLADIFRFQKFYRKWASRRPFDEFKDELYKYYYDQAHFTKEFKRMTGFPPQHFTHAVSNEFGRQLTVR